MFEIIRKIWKTGVVTRKLTCGPAPLLYRGKLCIEKISCNCCRVCAEACPAGAITIADGATDCTIEVSYGKCVFCGRCAEICPTGCLSFTQDYHLATKNKGDLLQSVTITID